MSKLFGWFSKNKKADKQKAQAEEARLQAEAEAKAKAQAEEEARAKAEAEAQAKAQAEEEARAKAEAEAKAKAQAEEEARAKAEAEAQAKAQAEEEARAKAEAEAQARAKAEEEARAKAEAEAQAKAQAEEEARAKAEAEAKAKAQAEEEARAKTEAEAQAKAQAEEEARAKAEAEAQAKAKAEEEARAKAEAEAQAKAQAEEEARAKAEAEAQAKAQAEEEARAKAEAEAQAKAKAEEKPKEKKSLFARLKESLSRTKENLGSGIVSLFKGKTIDDELYEDLETQLLVADVGMDTTQKIIDHLTDSASRKDLKDAEALLEIMKQQMSGMLSQVNQPLSEVMQAHDSSEGPFVILMVGVNGVGKTTTIGKLAKQFQQEGKKVMLAAGDTFRAAAVEQLQVWGERNDIPVIAQHTGADSASVLYDALEAAKSRGTDILIADTAGRLQNKNNLMEELKKVVRVMKKINPNAPHEVMLTLDAGTGQNAISQAKLFNEAVGLTGITLTKLDGTAKGGVIFSIADKFKIPIRYIGVGESIDDLRQFDGQEFIDALFSEMDTPES
ncbi:signal recognition particle-docking protein FtsY [Alteromonas sp. DY56-G5]|jgi:fused signal recognition particle receptor|uniref:signal recognition particle-docking protein FtsY n=2 Tax=Alteromonas TaxID=226 RepID=UPI00127AC90B|nr:signal recognition particle-docking protein FtsY [Alteromonas macleodii]MDM7963921.1 signal recognition particle-docking protein FtsY [Alteromonas macleodii]MDM8172379.1 signal recognition particle-docking protein FtsY [Alteromonas macleodii]CAI3968144.1 signal recognition particle-docking protein FtsY [Alteromonas macleodii]VTP57584.1 signal recognition particle-docking protein FtsY [Alteromonas macleodii]